LSSYISAKETQIAVTGKKMGFKPGFRARKAYTVVKLQMLG